MLIETTEKRVRKGEREIESGQMGKGREEENRGNERARGIGRESRDTREREREWRT